MNKATKDLIKQIEKTEAALQHFYTILEIKNNSDIDDAIQVAIKTPILSLHKTQFSEKFWTLESDNISYYVLDAIKGYIGEERFTDEEQKAREFIASLENLSRWINGRDYDGACIAGVQNSIINHLKLCETISFQADFSTAFQHFYIVCKLIEIHRYLVGERFIL